MQIPEAYFEAERVDLCLLFDLRQEPELHSRLTTALHGRYHHGSTMLSPLEQLGTLQSKHVSVDFQELIGREASVLTEKFPLLICNPHNPVYRGLHMCQRNGGSDEIISRR